MFEVGKKYQHCLSNKNETQYTCLFVGEKASFFGSHSDHTWINNDNPNNWFKEVKPKIERKYWVVHYQHTFRSRVFDNDPRNFDWWNSQDALGSKYAINVSAHTDVFEEGEGIK